MVSFREMKTRFKFLNELEKTIVHLLNKQFLIKILKKIIVFGVRLNNFESFLFNECFYRSNKFTEGKI